MKYPNASIGIRRIYLSEIIALIASIITAVSSVIFMACYEDPALIAAAGVFNIAVLVSLSIFIFS